MNNRLVLPVELLLHLQQMVREFAEAAAFAVTMSSRDSRYSYDQNHITHKFYRNYN